MDDPYPEGCGPDCPGCDPCVCKHPWSDHLAGGPCENCSCEEFDALFKARFYAPRQRIYE
jgi:hypothetical protein